MKNISYHASMLPYFVQLFSIYGMLFILSHAFFQQGINSIQHWPTENIFLYENECYLIKLIHFVELKKRIFASFKITILFIGIINVFDIIYILSFNWANGKSFIVSNPIQTKCIQRWITIFRFSIKLILIFQSDSKFQTVHSLHAIAIGNKMTEIGFDE